VHVMVKRMWGWQRLEANRWSGRRREGGTVRAEGEWKGGTEGGRGKGRERRGGGEEGTGRERGRERGRGGRG